MADPVLEKLWEAIEDAVINGWTVKKFLDEARSAWLEAVRDRIKQDDQQWAELLRPCVK